MKMCWQREVNGERYFPVKYVNIKMDRYAYMKAIFSKLKIFTFEHKVREMGDYSARTTNIQGSIHNFPLSSSDS